MRWPNDRGGPNPLPPAKRRSRRGILYLTQAEFDCLCTMAEPGASVSDMLRGALHRAQAWELYRSRITED